MSKSRDSAVLTRREALLLSTTAGLGAALSRPAFGSDSVKTGAHQEPGNVSTPRSAIAKTQYGKVRGFVDGGVLTFKGVPYGATTAGENRWLPSKPPAPWTDEYPALAYGANCPQTLHPWTSIEQTFLFDWDDGWQSEDMLKLNIWTPSLTGKRPVMFYMHGGGFSFGSSYELPSHEGAQMARLHDVVQVSVNHRLNILGFLDAAEIGGSAYEDSANVGMTDLVAALKWVSENIENFGGDPGRVMIFGQSGGGAKTSTVLAMPPGKGLFHRAAVQSGSALRLVTPEAGAATAEKLLKQLGIGKANMGDLQKIGWQQILEAQTAVGGNFSPVIGTDALPRHPFDPAAPPESANVPIIVSTTLEDAALGLTNFDLTEAGLKSLFDQRFGGKGTELLALYRKYDPIATPFLIQAQAFTDAGGRRAAYTLAARKAAQGGAPAYMYEWNWRTPAYDGKFGAVHGIDVSASFHSYRDGFFAGSTRGKKMADRLASAWAAFAATGDPNNGHIPPWKPYDDKGRAVMIFDNDTRLEFGPRAEIRDWWDAHPPAPGPRG
jgi:para-nitrobenzyl esterase